MMQKLTFRSKRNRSAVRQGVTDLEHVESLEVKHGDQTNVDEQDDALLGRDMSASPFFHAEYSNEVRKQVYNESLIYRTTPLYASKVAFEQRIDEHRLLQAHLQALERSEQNGPLLMPDEVMFSDILWSPADNNTTAIGGTGNPSLGGGGAAARRMYTAPRSTSIAQGGGGGGASLQPMPSGARAVSRYLSMPNQLTRFVGGRFPYAGYGGAESTGRRSQHSSEVEQGVDPGDDGSASAAASAAAEPQEAGGAFSVAGAASSAPVKGTGRGWWGDRRLGGRGLLGRRRTAPVSSRQRARDLSLQQSGFATGSGAGAIVSGGGGVRADLSHMRSSFETWGGGGGGGAESHRSVTGELISDVGGQPHVLKWSEWLERQRARGWYSSETLYFMTALGAVMGAGNFTSFWSQLQIWEGMLFIVPYCFNFFTIGVPAMQTEVLLGNLFRGSPVKCLTQINHWLVGAGVLTLLSNVLRVILKAAQSCHLLVYFLSSWKLPHPWQISDADRELCRSMLEEDTCERVGFSTLCHWLPEKNLCVASPTGKATHYYLSVFEPDVLDPDLSPNSLMLKDVVIVAVVWLLVLCYIWRGLFKLGFMSAMLIFMALILCLALIVICFVSTVGHGSIFDATPSPTTVSKKSTEDLWRLHAATIAFVLHDLTLGCGVFTTVSSFTKMGYNPVPSANYTCMTDFIVAAVAFISLMAVVVNMQHTSGVSIFDLVHKTQSAPAYFVIFPAALDRVAASNVFAMFFYGGISILNIQVAAIVIHSVINFFLECRLIRNRWRRTVCTALVVFCFVFTVPFCSVNEQIRYDFFNYLAMSFFTPLVVFIEAVSIGWVNNAKLQSNVAGEKAVKIYAALCFTFTAVFCMISVLARDVVFLPVIMLVAINALTAAVVAAAVREARASAHYFARVRALYVGNVEIWQEQVMRITLFNRPPIPVIAWLATLARMLCGCCLSPTRPLFVYRISLFWGITVKHLLPSATIYLVVQGLREFPSQWEMMKGSPGLRIFGVALLLLAFLLVVTVPFIPRLKWWMCPPADDYMPISMFPIHSYHPPPRVTLCQALSHLFKEFSSSSRHTSPYLLDLVSDYKRHQLLARRNTTGARGGAASDYLRRPGRRYSSLRDNIIGTGFESGPY